MPKNEQKRSSRKYWRDLGYRRCYCGTMLVWDNPDHPAAGTIEHLVPQSKGGTLAIKNTLLVCKTCNESRSSIDWYKWVEVNKPPKSDWLIAKYEEALLHYLALGKQVSVKIPLHVKQQHAKKVAV